MACENPKSTISQPFAFERSTHLNCLSDNFWSTVLQKISHHALNKVSTIRTRCILFENADLLTNSFDQAFNECQKSLVPLEHQVECTGAFSQAHGIPCSHKMKTIRDAGSVLQVNDFDAHRHLARAHPPHLPVMSSFHESIARLQERHAKLLPSEQSILQNEIDRLMEPNFH